jgi:hypothetical protein
MTTAQTGFPDAPPGLRSIMVETREQGTLACAPVLASDFPSVLVAGSLGGHSMQWHLSGSDAKLLAAALAAAGQAALEAEAQVQIEAGRP